jgi:preprotein translocase subunit YajC
MKLNKTTLTALFSGFLIQSNLLAQEATATATAVAGQPSMMRGLLVNLPPILALFALFYFGVIRPQKKQQKVQEDLLKKIGKGDEVVTNAGIIGKVTGLTERVITLEVDQGTEIKILRNQIQGYFKEALAQPTK